MARQYRIGIPVGVTSDNPLLPWAQQVTDILNVLPQVSSFSTSNPNSFANNSNVTADPGTLGINVGSVGSVFWIKQIGSGNTGWVAIA